MSTTVKNSAIAWVSVRHLQHIMARGEAAGVAMNEILAAAGLSQASLADADGLIPMTAIESMLSALSRRHEDPLIGLHLASDIQPATFGAIGYICQACNTFGDVLDVVTRYNGLLSNIGTTSIVFLPGTVELCWQCSTGSAEFRRQATEYVLGAFAVLARLLLPEEKKLLQAVNFTHARPGDTERMREYFSFFLCPVYFGKTRASVSLPASALNAKMHHGDAFMKDLLERHALELLRLRTQPSSLPDNVRHLLEATIIDGAPGKEVIAQQLGISTRSLHRKLQESGSSYQHILDEVRLEMACARLNESADSINAIAELLRFSSHQSFLRWFKQQTGATPGEYRKTGRIHHE